MSGLADELLESFRKGSDQAFNLIEQRKNQLTPALAEDLRARFSRTVAAGDGTTAFATSMLASVVYLRLGMRHEALQCFLDNIQIRFMAANDANAYGKVRTEALDCMAKATGISAPDIAFRAAVTAADCAYFAFEASSQNNADARGWMRHCLDDLETALSLASSDGGAGFLMKLASLLAQATIDVQSLIWFDTGMQAAIDAQLRRLATAAEQKIPVEFDCSGDPVKSRNVGQALAELSYKYGSVDNADARIAWLTSKLQ